MRTLSFIALFALSGCSSAPVAATPSQACGYSTTLRWQKLPISEAESQRFLALVKPIDRLRFGPGRAEAWFSNGFDEIVLCQYRLGVSAPCDAELLTVHFVKTNEVWSAGSVEEQICVS